MHTNPAHEPLPPFSRWWQYVLHALKAQGILGGMPLMPHDSYYRQAITTGALFDQAGAQLTP